MPKLTTYQVAVEAIGGTQPRAKTSQLALETIAPPLSAKAHAAQVAIEVVSRSGLGANYVGGNPARTDELTLEVLCTHAPSTVALDQLAVEVVSRSGLGKNYVPDHAARTDGLFVEVASRSGLGADPYVGNGAHIMQLAVEVVSFGAAPSAPPNGCDCAITPELPPVRYLMRRPGRFK